MLNFPQNNLVSLQFTQKVSELRDRTKIVAQEAVTGRQVDVTKHLRGNIGQAMLGQKALDDITTQRGVLGLRASRLDMVQLSLGHIHDRSVGLDARMLTAIGNGDTVGRNLVARDAGSALVDVFSALNVRYGDRFLFSGDATASAPLASPAALLDDIRQIATTATSQADFEAQLDTYFNDPSGGWLTSICAGTPASSDPDGVTGADPALIELISGLAVLAISGADENLALFEQEPGIIQTGALRVGTGNVALVHLRSDLGVKQEQIGLSLRNLDTEETVLTAVYNDLTGRDQYHAASELKLLEASLEASYMLTSRLSSLTLLNYLR